MTAQFARAPHQTKLTTPPPNATHAALLIDFDNVTMGIRSDITKELKNLLNSDIIKGKVAVQRAYADWRRYPQYVVPLAEGSVDLIFAPAYGSSKKNATDIRLAIDALELVFTRPEIGTFILLSGDSDFSSLVLKLKEYGKYVIGVGIRESASDLLVQNCDEYYSYSALTGLTRAGEEEVLAAGDPWELVDLAVQQMVSNNDVMRSDRLKQVLLELDANFNEKTLGFSKFNRFVAEAATRGMLRLHKLENGQFEIAVADDSVEEIVRHARRAAAEGEAVRNVSKSKSEGGAEEDEPRPEKPRERRPAAQAETGSSSAPTRDGGRPDSDTDGLKQAYELLLRAAKELGATGDRAVRDSDVKRRMLDFEPDWDESAIGFGKFSRFLRQAHDAEVINLRKIDTGNYEVVLPGAAADDAAPDGRRGRRDRGPAKPERQEDAARGVSDEPASRPQPTSVKPAGTIPEGAVAAPPVPKAPEAPRPVGLRRGSRAPRPSAAPPLLEGQVVATSRSAPAAPTPAAAPKLAQAAPKAAPSAPRPMPAKPPAVASFGLPAERAAIIDYMTKSYKGIGAKTAESLIDEVGPAAVFDTLQDAPDRVIEIVGSRRGETLLAAWKADYAKRAAAQQDAGDRNGGGARRSGRRRGGRGRKRPAPAAG